MSIITHPVATTQWALRTLGLSKKKFTTIVVGIDDEGRNAMVQQMVDFRPGILVPQKPPAAGHPVAHTSTADITLWSMEASFRAGWHSYYWQGSAFIFVFDACDRSKFKEAREEIEIFKSTSIQAADRYDKHPFVVVGCRKGTQDAATKEELWEELGMDKLTSFKQKELFVVSPLTGEGICEVLDWVVERVTLDEIYERESR